VRPIAVESCAVSRHENVAKMNEVLPIWNKIVGDRFQGIPKCTTVKSVPKPKLTQQRAALKNDEEIGEDEDEKENERKVPRKGVGVPRLQSVIKNSLMHYMMKESSGYPKRVAVQ